MPPSEARPSRNDGVAPGRRRRPVSAPTPLNKALRPALPPWLGAALAALIGAGVPLQSRVNGELGAELGDPVLAAAISLLGGMVVLVALALTVPRVRRGVRQVPAAVRSRQIRPGYLLAGSVGALFLLTQVATVVLLGVAVFIVAVVAGQALGGLGTDATGFAGHARRKPTPRRLLGAALVVLAVLLPAATTGTGGGPALLLPAVVVVVVGVLTAFQHSANARVGSVVGSPLAATVLNFSVGTTLMVIATAVRLATTGLPQEWPTDWWLYLGGIFGIVFIAGSAALIPHIGMLVMGLGSVAGQLAVSLLLDVLAPVSDAEVSGAMVAGTALALLAVAITTVPRRKPAVPDRS